MRCARKAVVVAAALALSCAGPRVPKPPPCTDLTSCTAVLRAPWEASQDDERASDAAALVGAFGPGACPVVIELLQSPSRHRQLVGAHALHGLTTADLDCAVPAFVADCRATDRDDLLREADGLRDPRVASMLVDMVSGNDNDVTLTRLRLLASMGDLARGALPRLAALASSHWKGSIRRAAAGLYKAISGETIEPAPDRCPASVRHIPESSSGEERWTVTLASGSVELESAWAPKKKPPQACALAKPDAADAVLAVGDECLTGRYRFECGGGGIDVWRGAARTSLGAGGASRFVRREDDVLAIDACSHVSWGVERLARASSGRWTLTRLLSASASGQHLEAFAIDLAGGVDLLVQDDEWGVGPNGKPPCSGRTVVQGVKGLTTGGFELLHVDATGQVVERE
jgi:hypothetical protein